MHENDIAAITAESEYSSCSGLEKVKQGCVINFVPRNIPKAMGKNVMK